MENLSQQTLTESIEGVQSSVQSAMTDIEAVTVSKSTENKVIVLFIANVGVFIKALLADTAVYSTLPFF